MPKARRLRHAALDAALLPLGDDAFFSQ